MLVPSRSYLGAPSVLRRKHSASTSFFSMIWYYVSRHSSTASTDEQYTRSTALLGNYELCLMAINQPIGEHVLANNEQALFELIVVAMPRNRKATQCSYERSDE